MTERSATFIAAARLATAIDARELDPREVVESESDVLRAARGLLEALAQERTAELPDRRTVDGRPLLRLQVVGDGLPMKTELVTETGAVVEDVVSICWKLRADELAQTTVVFEGLRVDVARLPWGSQDPVRAAEPEDTTWREDR